jgi:hypothetical protein
LAAEVAMKRLGIGLFSLFVLVGAAGGARRAAHHPGGDICAGFTASKLLQDPEMARTFSGALDGRSPAARAHLDAFVSELREAHGCAVLEGSGDAPALHSPGRASRLPPGHPPIDGAPGIMLFGDDQTKTLTI